MIDDGAALGLAGAALRHWGGAEAPPRLVKNRENVVFEVRLRQGPRVALRLHRPGYQTRSAIESELGWMAALATRGFPLPAPVPTLDGGWTAVGTRIASCVTWLEGEPIGAAERRLEGDAAAQTALFGDLGRLIGRLHNDTDAGAVARPFSRPVWDTAGFLGDAPLWGRFWENPAFSASERAVIEAARHAASQQLRDGVENGADFGPIHADLLRENILRRDGQLMLIDFDDCGPGFRLYDLATALVQSLEEPHLPGFPPALVEGYRSVRHLRDEDAARLPLFVALRTFASAGWIATRATPDDPRQRFYAARALRMAHHVIAGTAPWNA